MNKEYEEDGLTCRKCNLRKPMDEFNRSKKNRIGYYLICKQCSKEYAEKNHYQHRAQRLSRQSCHDRTHAGYYLKLKNNAAKRKHEFDIDKLEFLIWLEAQEKKCHYCGVLLTKGGNRMSALSFDRKDNGRDYTLDNLALCCYSCNSVKGNVFTEYEMIEIGQKYIAPKKMRGEL